MYSPFSNVAGAHLVVRREQLRGLAEVEAGPERPGVRLGHLRPLGEPLGDPLDRRLDRPGVEPADEAEGEEVLRPLRVARLDAGLLADLLGDRRHRDLVHRERAERPVGQRVRVVAGLRQAAVVERVDVDDERRPLRQRGDVRPQRGRVHRHQDVRGIARRQDVVVGDVDLERGDAGQRAGRRPDLGREVRERRQVVAEQRARRREPVPGELHPVTGVPGEPDDYPVQLLRYLFTAGRQRPCPSSLVTGRRLSGAPTGQPIVSSV